MGKYQLAVDVGGTFTDVFIFDEESKKISVTKVSSTPHNPAVGILTGIAQSAVSTKRHSSVFTRNDGWPECVDYTPAAENGAGNDKGVPGRGGNSPRYQAGLVGCLRRCGAALYQATRSV
ncbi:UNVERIFIED_CONTAM: hypothetical protein ABID98_000070 [Brevibacillus sp. OAP136]